MLNRSILIGRLTKDVELKHVGNDGVAFARFSIAVNRKYNRDEADFINIVAWRKTAELCEKYLRKGSQVAIEGRIQTGKYDNQDGVTVYTTDVVADSVQFLDTKGSGKKEAGGDPFTGEGKEIVIDDADLPF